MYDSCSCVFLTQFISAHTDMSGVLDLLPADAERYVDEVDVGGQEVPLVLEEE